jgi:serine/threonine-protein kinase
MSQPSPDRLVGQVLGDTYHLARLVGEGGMGRVYEADHLRLSKKRFAIKVLHSAAVEDPTSFARFRREAEIATEIGHPNIVDVIDFNVTGEGQPYIVMELLEGMDLQQLLAREVSLPPEKVCEIAAQVGSALEAAHAKGIVHRDLKPENIFLASVTPVHVKLLDFGLSKIQSGRSRLTQDHTVFGTPSYMSPEQAEGRIAEVDHATDIFALGVIAYLCLTGKLPFDGPTVPGILYQVCHSIPPPATELVASLPAKIDEVLARAMAKRKVDRYQRVMDLVDDLRAALGVPARPDARQDEGRTLPVDLAPGTDAEVETNRVPLVAVAPEKTLHVVRAARRRRIATAAATFGILAVGVVVALVIAHWGASSESSGHADKVLVAAPDPTPGQTPPDVGPRRPDVGSPPAGPDLAPPDAAAGGRIVKHVRRVKPAKQRSLKHHGGKKGPAKGIKQHKKDELNDDL